MLAVVPKPLEYAEIALIAAGLLVCVVAAARLTLRRSWGALARFGPTAPTRFTLIDLLVYLMLTWFIASLCATLAGNSASATTRSAATRPATHAADPAADAREKALAMFFSPLAGAAFLVTLVPLRVEGSFRGWSLNLAAWRRAARPAVLGYLAIWPFCAGVLWLTRLVILRIAPDHHFEGHTTLNLLRATREGPAWLPTLLILGAVLAAPLSEELFFRGLIQSMISRAARSTWAGILASALIFGAFHYSTPETIPPLILFGLALAYAFARTQSLATPILMHVLFNAKTILWLALGAEA